MSQMELTDNLVPLRRPHFQLRGRQLFFLISRRPHAEFDGPGAELWEKIDGTITLGRLRVQFPDINDRIRQFWDLGIIEVAPEYFAPQRRRVLVIEPHMDDAVLSVGGVMWLRRNECEFTVLSLVGVSNFTSYHRMDREYFDIDTVTRLRCAESETVMRVLGGKHQVLDRHDAPLRYQPGKWTRAWYVKHRRSISASINHSSTAAELESQVASMIPVLASTDAQEIWIPLGVGTSTDHEITRNATLQALLRLPDVTRRVDIWFYQDVPYANQFPWHTAQIVAAFVAAGGQVEQVCDDIRTALPDKLRLLSIFGSQFKPSYMDPKVIATAHQAFGSKAGYGELRFRVKKLPTQVDPSRFYSGRKYIEAQLARLSSWYPRHRNAERIRILSPVAVGRWQDDVPVLLEAFPNAVLEIHLTGDAMDETQRFVSPRIELHPIQGLKAAWIRRILQLVFSRPRPLIVLTSAKLAKLHPLVRILFFPSNPLPATTTDHLVQALRQLISSPASNKAVSGTAPASVS